MDKPFTAYIYARVSTEEQATGGVSLDDQLARCRARAEQLGATVSSEWVDAGESAYVGSHRPQFEAALIQAAYESPTYFICWSSSRFARDRLRATAAKRALAKASVQLVYCNASIDLQDSAGAMIDGIFEVLDEASSRQNSQDTSRAMLAAARQGFWVNGLPPYGYRLEPVAGLRRKRLIIDEPCAAIVRRIFDLRLQGEGAGAIAKILQAEGTRNRVGRPWTLSSVLALLRNRLMTGTLVFGARPRHAGSFAKPVVASGVYPAIIDEQRFANVQAMVSAAAPQIDSSKATSARLLSGLLRCRHCNTVMQTQSGTGRHGQVYNYYNCAAWMKRGECQNQRIRADLLDADVARVICAQVFKPQLLTELLAELETNVSSWQRDRDLALLATKRDHAEVSRRQANLFDVLELHGRDAPNMADLTRRMRENKARLADLDIQLARMQDERPPKLQVSAAAAFEVGRTVVAALQDPSNYKRSRTWIASFVHTVVAEDDEIQLTYDPARLVLGEGVQRTEKWRPEQESNLWPFP